MPPACESSRGLCCPATYGAGRGHGLNPEARAVPACPVKTLRAREPAVKGGFLTPGARGRRAWEPPSWGCASCVVPGTTLHARCWPSPHQRGLRSSHATPGLCLVPLDTPTPALGAWARGPGPASEAGRRAVPAPPSQGQPALSRQGTCSRPSGTRWSPTRDPRCVCVGGGVFHKGLSWQLRPRLPRRLSVALSTAIFS